MLGRTEVLEQIKEFQEVIRLTTDKTDIVSIWARQGVKAKASAGISYLKRRVAAQFKTRHNRKTIDIKRAIVLIRLLQPIFDA